LDFRLRQKGIPMKTTIEIPDELFRQVKAKAALSGIHLRELVELGLRLALDSDLQPVETHHTQFPLIPVPAQGAKISDDDVKAALAAIEEESVADHAIFMRR
jgi:hypothetical protein